MIVAGTELRSALERVGYGEEGIAAALGIDVPVGPNVAAANLRRLDRDSPLAVAIRLFVIGERVPYALAANAFDVDGLVAERLAELDADELVPLLGLRLWNDVLVAHDFHRPSLPADHVVGVHPATRTVAALTVRKRVGRALDVGTGCGVQALLAAKHADEVVATDVNARALGVARLSARLNGVELDLREGSLFDPVDDERFDLIVSNPPYVISPDAELVFRDGGFRRDELSRAVVRGLAEHLAEGGFATTLVSWLHADDDWTEPLRAWVGGSGCDALLLRYVCSDPLEYALKWGEPDDVDRWVAYYEEHDVARISTGAVVLRRRAAGGANWVETVDADAGPSGSAGAQIERIFAGRDLLESGVDLLGERLALVPHRLEEQLAWTGHAYAPARLALALDEGVGVECAVDAVALQTLFRLDGSRPLGELPDARAALPTIERLVRRGFVERRT